MKLFAYIAERLRCTEGPDGQSGHKLKCGFEPIPHLAWVSKVFTSSICLLLLTTPTLAQTSVPDWCRSLPRPGYTTLKRIPVHDPWFEVYRVAPYVLAIYEPHQSEETIGYLILGQQRALLFDTGMGIGDLRALVSGLTSLPVVVLNSHTHDDHVGNNWQFQNILSMDTPFTRQNARGSRSDAQDEIAPGQVCGTLPSGFNPKTYATHPWKITAFVHDLQRTDLGGGERTSSVHPVRASPRGEVPEV